MEPCPGRGSGDPCRDAATAAHTHWLKHFSMLNPVKCTTVGGLGELRGSEIVDRGRQAHTHTHTHTHREREREREREYNVCGNWCPGTHCCRLSAGAIHSPRAARHIRSFHRWPSHARYNIGLCRRHSKNPFIHLVVVSSGLRGLFTTGFTFFKLIRGHEAAGVETGEDNGGGT